MIASGRRRRAYLVRCWVESSTLPSLAQESARWRFYLEEIHSRQGMIFDDPDALISHLRQQLDGLMTPQTDNMA